MRFDTQSRFTTAVFDEALASFAEAYADQSENATITMSCGAQERPYLSREISALNLVRQAAPTPSKRSDVRLPIRRPMPP
jgi:hypothetical protein